MLNTPIEHCGVAERDGFTRLSLRNIAHSCLRWYLFFKKAPFLVLFMVLLVTCTNLGLNENPIKAD